MNRNGAELVDERRALLSWPTSSFMANGRFGFEGEVLRIPRGSTTYHNCAPYVLSSGRILLLRD